MSDTTPAPPLALLTPADLRARLQVSQQTYRRLLQRGMPCRMVMSDRRFVWDDVLAWLPSGARQRTVQAGPATFDMTALLKHRAKTWGQR